MLALAKLFDTINEWIGKSVRWLALAMVIIMSINVFMRYLFALGDPWQQELVRFMHAALFLLAAGYALKYEAHVRVDILYHNYSSKKKAVTNLFGTLFLLFPVAFSLIWFSYDYVTASWAIQEGSNEYNGMPGVFLLKTCIWGCGATLIMQGISVVLHSLHVLTGGKAHG